jgi:hypothetical protein
MVKGKLADGKQQITMLDAHVSMTSTVMTRNNSNHGNQTAGKNE